MAILTRSLADITLIVRAEDDWETPAAALADRIAALADQAPGLKDGVTVRFGGSLLTLVRQGNVLTVTEPDFAGDPITGRREDVTATLRLVVAQAEFLSRWPELVPTDARFDDKVLLAREGREQPRVYLERLDPVPGDSGWYLGLLDAPTPDVPEAFEAVRVAELIRRRPAVAAVLGLPAGWLVEFDGDRVVGVWDATGAERWNAGT